MIRYSGDTGEGLSRCVLALPCRGLRLVRPPYSRIASVVRMPCGLLAAVAMGLVLASPAIAVRITDFPVEPGAAPGAHVPYFLISGPGGDLWFTDYKTGVGRMSPAGVALPPVWSGGQAFDLVRQADDTVWWTAGSAYRRTPSGSVSSIPAASGSIPAAIALATGGAPYVGAMKGGAPGYECVVSPGGDCFAGSSADTSVNSRVTGLALGRDGEFFAASYENDRVLRFSTTSFDTGFGKLNLPPGSGPYRVAVGPDGNAWVVEYKANAIDRITPQGQRQRFAVGGGPNDIVSGPDGALWFTEFGANKIGRITAAGAVTEYPVPTPGSTPWGITVGPDGNIWFTESTAGKIGRLAFDRAGTPGGGGPGGAIFDRVAPRFSAPLKFSPTRFRVSSKATPVSAKRRATPIGSSLRYTLSEPATVTIVIAQPRAGRRVGKSCRAPSKSNRHRARCTRYVTVGTLKRRALQGPNQIAFSGRVGRKPLRAGGYQATATATDSAGFTVVR
jgi:virginiamycin B lyase